MEIQSPRNEDSVIIYSWPTLMERCGEVLQQHSQLKERKMSLCSSSGIIQVSGGQIVLKRRLRSFTF